MTSIGKGLDALINRPVWKKHIFGFRISTLPSQTDPFSPLSKYWINEVQWSRILGEGSRDNVESQKWSYIWPKSRITSPFQSMGTGEVSEIRFRWKSVGVCSSYDVIAPWRDLTWPGKRFFLPEAAMKIFHKLCEVSALSDRRFGGHFRKKARVGGHEPRPCADEG